MAIAVSLIEVNSLEQARDAFEEARKIKETPLVFYNLGVVSFQLKNLSQSIAHFEKSLQLDPDSADAHSCHNNLATCYIFGTPPNTEKGIEHLKKAVELKPQDGEVRFNLGAVLESAGHIEDAYRQYFAAKELGVSQAEPHMRNVS
ncbi:TPR-like protein [Atractiella rhizophila]|nr:TPR-like protein [Atractiella rhizophila]